MKLFPALRLLPPIGNHAPRQYSRTRPGSLPAQVPYLASIELTILKASGFRGIILDLDNTIVSEDDRYLSPGAETWLQQAKQQGIQCILLSNGKRRYRTEFWSQRLQTPCFSPAGKPNPRIFHRALAAMQLQARDVVVIGDSWHTDLLGAWLVGCRSIQVASLPHPPRWWERLVGRWIQMPYPPHLDLWEFNQLSYHHPVKKPD